MSNSKTNNSKISTEIILALASLGIYLCAFYYEKGYASVFDIPLSFISISLTSLLTFGGIIIGAVLFAMPLANLLLLMTKQLLPPSIVRALLPIIILLALLYVEIYLYGIENWQKSFPIKLVLFMLFFVLFLQLILPLMTQRRVKKYSEKLTKQEDIERNVQEKDIYGAIEERFGSVYLIIIMVFLIGIFIASSAGEAEALRQKDFLVTNTNPEMVVLRIYGDNLICATFDRKTHTVERMFTIIKITSDQSLTLKLEEVGPLHLKTSISNLQISPIITPTSTYNPTP